MVPYRLWPETTKQLRTPVAGGQTLARTPNSRKVHAACHRQHIAPPHTPWHSTQRPHQQHLGSAPQLQCRHRQLDVRTHCAPTELPVNGVSNGPTRPRQPSTSPIATTPAALLPQDPPPAPAPPSIEPPPPLIPALTTDPGSSVSPLTTLQQSDDLPDQPSEAGLLPEEALDSLAASSGNRYTAPKYAFSYAPKQRSQIRESWDTLMRWSKAFRTRSTTSLLESTDKVVVFGGGSFGTAIATSLARQKADLDVVLLLRDPYLCHDINTRHINTKYLKDHQLPPNVRATTSATEAVPGAQFAVHAVPVQHSRALLESVRHLLPATVPIICVSKGLEVATGQMMSELIPSALGRKQPAVFLSGPSFAKEVMERRPTGVVAACRDPQLARQIQALFASQAMRVNMTTDVVGVEICGALKNVLAIAAGIVEGLGLGNNALAALIAQGCSEIRWLAEKMGARPTTMSGLSGLGDIMLTCYGSLSRNRTVGIRLGQGERLQDILASSNQVAEGVATAGVVVALARKYRVSLPVLTAVAQVLDNNLTPSEAVHHIMNLPQVEEH